MFESVSCTRDRIPLRIPHSKITKSNSSFHAESHERDRRRKQAFKKDKNQQKNENRVNIRANSPTSFSRAGRFKGKGKSSTMHHGFPVSINISDLPGPADYNPKFGGLASKVKVKTRKGAMKDRRRNSRQTQGFLSSTSKMSYNYI